jgi:leucyl aminopeptidase
MDIQLSFDSLDQVETQALAVVVFEKESPYGPRVERNAALRQHIQSLVDAGEFKGTALETLLYHRPAGLKAARLLLIGGGKRERFGPVELRRAAGAAARFLKSKSVSEFAFVPDGSLGDAESAVGAVEGAIVGDFELEKYKTEKKDEKHIERLLVAGLEAGAREAIEPAALRARVLAEAQNFARSLINEPSNRMTPALLAEAARAMAAAAGLHCEVLDREAMERLNMGALLAVARGSAEPPAMIVLKYSPPDAPEKPVLGLVGKGITFDTGGISIKPSEGMEKMKYDMAGGASMIAAMRAIAELKPRLRVMAVVPATENMPGGRAQKPGDIQVAMSGKTIEVLNTDAEGRMVLADALHYARTLGCTHLVDAATLTGACAIALGAVNVGAFTNEQPFLDRFLAVARAEGERVWQLPLDDEYREQIRGHMADILNTGGRFGGAITAAIFLKEFVDDTPWIHLDIAGTAWMDEPKPYIARGSSGVMVRSLAGLVLDLAEVPSEVPSEARP